MLFYLYYRAEPDRDPLSASRMELFLAIVTVARDFIRGFGRDPRYASKYFQRNIQLVDTHFFENPVKLKNFNRISLNYMSAKFIKRYNNKDVYLILNKFSACLDLSSYWSCCWPRCGSNNLFYLFIFTLFYVNKILANFKYN